MMKQEVYLANPRENFVNFNSVDLSQSKVGLNPINVVLALSPEVSIHGVPYLQKHLQQESPTTCGRIEHEMVVVDVEHRDREPGKLPHGEVLAELAAKYGPKEAFKRDADVIDVGAREAD